MLALEVADGGCAPIPALACSTCTAHDLDAISGGRQRGRLGERLGESDKVHFAPPGFPGALPLAGLLFLRRGPDVAATAIAPLENAPTRLLGNAFLPYLDRAERLARQLEVMSRLAQTVSARGARHRAG